MKLKNLAALILFLMLLLSLAACGGKPVHLYTQEYVAGRGNIKGNGQHGGFPCTGRTLCHRCDGGRHSRIQGPGSAYEALTEQYADGLALIRQEKGLLPITRKNYSAYKTYGWQVTGGSQEAQSQAHFII